MKNLFLFISVILSFTLTIQFQCPLNSNLQPIDGAFADPEFCGVYYHCISGTPFPQQCPPGLFFTVSLTNCEYSTCVEPEEAECPGGNSTLIVKNQDFRQCSTEPDEVMSFEEPCYMKNSDCDGKMNGTYPNNNDCRQYYHCYNGLSWPQQCPDGYFFSPSLNVRDCTTKMCVTIEESECPMPGGWSEWSSWSDCDPSCGDGLRTRTRSCTNPPPMNGGEDCPGNSVDIDLCFNPPCGVVKEPAFMVSMRSDDVIRAGIIRWQRINHNRGNVFNILTNSLRINETGFYYGSLTFSIRRTTSFQVSSRGSAVSHFLHRFTRDSTAAYSESLTRAGTKLYTTINSPRYDAIRFSLITGSPEGSETSWTGFRYETNNVFYVASTTSILGREKLIAFNSVLTLRGLARQSPERLTVSTDGWYFVNLGSGFSSRSPGLLSFVINDHATRPEYSLGRKSSNYVGESQGSRGFIVRLNANDQIGVKLIDGTSRSNSGALTYMTGFKITATSDKPAFFSYSSVSQSITTRRKLAFDTVVLDVSSGWSTIDNTYKVAVSGLYYIEISVGVFPQSQSVVEVVVNNDVMLGMRYLSTTHNAYDVKSRGGLLQVQEGDSISIETSNPAYSDELKLTSFTLFYISS
ncbi:DgyrCDS2148 [Dimorphilus gyrociliatus]|uniref:DgyrCDS2148 n=1 Tax=Dimorphilus gyrociliatus TaxID=2664684 RepID=A0A7I8VEH8_9ANNE|nr:DgyrCDS2148 [Dimorphilus gyrociliatus]